MPAFLNQSSDDSLELFCSWDTLNENETSVWLRVCGEFKKKDFSLDVPRSWNILFINLCKSYLFYLSPHIHEIET